MEPAPLTADFLVVTDVFQISGRGLIVALSLAAWKGWSMTVGDTAIFERPDGSMFRTTIMGIDVPRTSPPGASLALLLGQHLTSKDMVPIGTKLLSVERKPPGVTQ